MENNPNIKWEKQVRIKRSGYFSALIVSVMIATLLGIFGLCVEIIARFNEVQRIIFWSILALFFAIFMPLLVPTKKTQTIKLIGKQETIYETIREVKKPVTQFIEVEKPKKKLSIPKYDFLGSNETMTYHKRNCRFSKLIKPKHKLSNNDEDFFRKAGFSKCKVCMPKKK